MKNSIRLALIFTLMSSTAFAATQETAATDEAEVKQEKLADMSDPLAVFGQVGMGATNRGLNLKFGQIYDTGDADSKGMKVLEVRGFYGETLGYDEGASIDNSLDSIRLRDVEVNTKNGRGTQLEYNLNFDSNAVLGEQSGSIAYSFIQALPKMGPVNLFPLAGAGVSFGNNACGDDITIASADCADMSHGFSVQGAYTLLGMYSKIEITDKLWLNYNPVYLSALAGSVNYKNHAYGINNDALLTHEFAVNYRISKRLNVRYFANWNENLSFSEGDHRIEFNYQL